MCDLYICDSPFILIFNRWLNPLFKIGHKRRLEEDDMYSVLPEDRSQHLGEELQGYWDQEVLRAEKDVQEPSLTKAIVKCHWKSYLVLGIFILLEVKAFIYCALIFTICRSVLRWMGPVGREARSLRSEDKMSRNHDVAQKLCLSLECTHA
ncbi:hypothetical protein FD755_024804 [Muntiacus reevesi]|uniref:Uncharacterized protein n=1 Tax=Muntiacus reevesi TaxID=9886 RepID=A0A5N3UU49_MUNRE|nr:hypothetical protein FD755_024804 [Muntiacus reevesi]